MYSYIWTTKSGTPKMEIVWFNAFTSETSPGSNDHYIKYMLANNNTETAVACTNGISSYSKRSIL